MADSIQIFLAHVGRGCLDSLKGISRMFSMDKGIENDTESKRESEQPMSILAQRRAERNRAREIEKKPIETQKVLPRIWQCCVFNGGLFMASYLLFYSIVLPFIGYLTRLFVSFLFGGNSGHATAWSYIEPMLAAVFNCCWILPLFVLSKIINSLWFQDIADAAYRKTRGRPRTIPNFSTMIADVLFSLVLQTLFLIQGMLVSLVPLPGVGFLASHLHMCLLYSFYAFEYKWLNMGWEVNRRLSYIENNWPYFVGFGLPLAITTALPSAHVISGCIFAICFPVFIISANEADNVVEQYNNPLKIFSGVVYLTNKIFKRSVRRQPAMPARTASPPSSSTSSPKRVTLQEQRR